MPCLPKKNIIGIGFFSFSDDRTKNSSAKVISRKSATDGKLRRVTIAPNSLYGKPTTADLDKYLAFQRILLKIKDRNGGIIANPIMFTPSELLNELGHSGSGSNFKEINRWLDVMSSTQIKSENMLYSKRKQRFVSDSFVVFQRVKRIKEVIDGEPAADKITVWLSDWYLENIEDNYVLEIDFDIYKFLEKTIAKLLFPHLHIWLFASRRRGIFEKRYADFCHLLGIHQYEYLSQIKNKLGPALDELVAVGYLSVWSIAKTTDQADFKVRLKPELTVDRNYSEIGGLNNRSNNNKQLGKNPAVEPIINELNDKQPDLVRKMISDFGINRRTAVDLVRSYSANLIRKQMSNPVFSRPGSVNNRAAFLIRAIENEYSIHVSETENRKSDDVQQNYSENEILIKNCNLCDECGKRYIKSEKDTFYGLTHECSHNPDEEKQYEDHI